MKFIDQDGSPTLRLAMQQAWNWHAIPDLPILPVILPDSFNLQVAMKSALTRPANLRCELHYPNKCTFYARDWLMMDKQNQVIWHHETWPKMLERFFGGDFRMIIKEDGSWRLREDSDLRARCSRWHTRIKRDSRRKRGMEMIDPGMSKRARNEIIAKYDQNAWNHISDLPP